MPNTHIFYKSIAWYLVFSFYLLHVMFIYSRQSTSFPICKLHSVSTENLAESFPNESNSEHSTAAEAQKIVKRKSRNRRKRPKVQKPDIEIKKRVPHRSGNATPTEITTDDEDMITYDVEEEELEQDPFILPKGYLRVLTPSRYRNYRE
ncbi:hypothetical protein TNCV_4919871 [Trichonephila clavipes]|nr:hypothetical protein TNCV_4919871 [Trichonephila clavipes]